jgi:hypothetical protein
MTSLLQGAEFDYALELRNETQKNYLRDSALNPQNLIGLHQGLENLSYTSLDFKLYFLENLGFTFYDTLYFQYNEEKENDKDNIFKQGYATFNLFRRFFLDLGKKVERNGISFYKNPTDFMIHQGELDLSKSKEEQTKLLEGIILAKAEFFLTKRISLSFAYSPLWEKADNTNEQYLGKLVFQMNSSDLEFIVYYNTFYKYGFNYSINVKNNLEFHLEGAVSEKGTKWEVEKLNQFILLHEKSTKYSPEFLIGGHLTFAEKGNLYFEYFYNHNGDTFSQWQNIGQEIEENKKSDNPVHMVNILTLNDLVKQTGFTYLRRHYAMLRYEKDNIRGDFSVRLTAVWEIPDIAGLCIISPIYQITDDFQINFDFFYYNGIKNSSFYYMYYKYAVRFSAVYNF